MRNYIVKFFIAFFIVINFFGAAAGIGTYYRPYDYKKWKCFNNKLKVYHLIIPGHLLGCPIVSFLNREL